jgi:hypothetical protein
MLDSVSLEASNRSRPSATSSRPVDWFRGSERRPCLHLAAWLLAGVAGWYVSAEFWAMLAFQYVVAAILLAIVLVSVRRRPCLLAPHRAV